MMVGDVWAEVYDADWQKRADAEGPVNLVSASVTRVLDGCGTISFETLGTDERAIRLLTNEARVKIYVNDGGTIRQFCSGIIRKIRKSVSASGWTRSYEGPDALDELKRKTVLLNRQFQLNTITDVATTLAAIAGWSVETETAISGELMTARFDGVSVLKALQRVVELKGYHLREKPRPLSSFDRTLEIGLFGTDIGLTCLTLAQAVDIGDNDAIALIESLQVALESEDVINWLLPLGGGEGEAALTLQKSTRSGIKTTTGPDGKTLYYITDAASVALYGEIQKVGTFKDINPIANSVAATQAAANALYDTARAYLDRAKARQDVYRMTLKKCRVLVRPGDKVRVLHRGDILDENGVEIPDEIVDGTFWVLKASERVGNDGSVTTSLEISNIDKQTQDAATLVVDAVENINIRNLTPTTYPNTFVYPFVDYICGGIAPYYREAEFPLQIDSSITDIVSARIYITTQPIDRFSLFNYSSNPFSVTPPPFDEYAVVQQHYNYPSDVRLLVNSIDVTSALGGPWNVAPTNSALSLSALDITAYLTSSTIYQEHIFKITCGARQGNWDWPKLADPDGSIPTPVGYGTASLGRVIVIVVVQAICQAILPI